jgi:lipoprotein-anchoring transpeptidase ErfK/SrfK
MFCTTLPSSCPIFPAQGRGEVETSNMHLRTAAGLIAFVCSLASVHQAGAQYYPGPYVPAPPPGYRELPAGDDDFDEPTYVPAAPGPYGAPSRAETAYPADPARSSPPGIQQQALPAPAPSQPYLGDRPPTSYEPSRDTRREPYVVPYDPRGVAREASPNDNYGASPIRPPGDIAATQGGPILDLNRPSAVPGQPAAPAQAGVAPHSTSVATLPPDYEPETEIKELPPQFKRQLVDYATKEPAGTIVIDTPNTFLYLVLGNGKAMRYGIGVGREGFTWSGAEKISRMAEWPDWHPPAEMIERQPYLPRFMAGGETNPMGARALYLGKTLYRIHGTNQPSTIGTNVSSGCIRLVNDDIADLYSRVQVGTRVVVLPARPPASASVAR